MRSQIDYRKYDPADYKQDHPSDPVLADARSKAEVLSASLKSTELEGTPQDQRRQIEQQFDELHQSQWDINQARNADEQKQALVDYTFQKTDALYQQAMERVAQGRNRDERQAAWDGVPKTIADARSTAKSDPEYKERQEQLTQFQAARSEAASQEIHDVQQQLLQVRGLDKIDLAPPEPPAKPVPENKMNEALIPSDKMTKHEQVRESPQSFEDAMRERIQDAKKTLERPPAEQDASKSQDHSIG